MTVHLITFASPEMSRSAVLCANSAAKHSADIQWLWTPDVLRDTEFYKTNRTLLDQPRGCGFWAWKPFIVHSLLINVMQPYLLKDGDVIIYADAGVEFINSVNYIIDRMDQDIFLFGNMYEHAHWCRRDIIEAITPNTPWSAFSKQVQASVIFFRVSDYTRRFVAEWLAWCLTRNGHRNPGPCSKCDAGERDHAVGYLIDDSLGLYGHLNHPEFQENRHDQAILTTMVYRDGIPLSWWPAVYNDGAFTYPRGDYPDLGIPPLFHHHRKRDIDWAEGRVRSYREGYQVA